MRKSEKKLYEEESEARPNRYIALALTILSFFLIGLLLVNEVGLFRVVKERMRFSVFAALLTLEIPLFIAGTDTGLYDKRTKYMMIICSELVSAILCIVLTFHATLILLLPMLLAAQYPSMKPARIALFSSMVVAFISPLISYKLGMWDTAFLSRLCQISGVGISEVVAQADILSERTCVIKILLYLSTPHALILLAFSPLSLAISKNGAARLRDQIQVLHMSESDTLTGLLNRLSFEQAILHKVTEEDGDVAVIYADANNLHHLNNELGHAEGDRLLVCVAERLLESFGNESVYRIGGDEFVCILYGMSLEDVQEHMTQVCAGIEQYGYSISVGIEYAQAPCTLSALLTAAEVKMQIDKQRYHITR